jgi:DNA ligase (NAD+)
VIERSGDVIPKIVSVDTPTEPDMPERKYVWNDTETDIMVEQKDNEDDTNDVKKKQFEFLLTTIKFDHLGKGVIAKLYKSNINSLVKLYSLSKDDILKIEGFKEKSADKLYKSIQKRRKELVVLDYMVASNIFGRGLGTKNLSKIIERYPINSSFTVDDIVAIDGIGNIYAKKYVEALPKFKQFLVTNNLDDVSNEPVAEKTPEVVVENNDMKAMNIVFTGFRDKQLEECVNKKGGKIATSISKKITHLVCKEINEGNSKQKKAKEMDIKILTRTEFENKYC